MEGTLRGVPSSVQPIFLAPKLPTGVRICRVPINPLDAQLLSELSLVAAPSGSGELVISGLAYANEIVTFTAAGGQPTRCYTLLLTATRSDSQVADYLLKIQIDAVLVTDQPQSAPSAGFGTALTWAA